jgi:pimeloyl-ACP methyl ester carboxylesterase
MVPEWKKLKLKVSTLHGGNDPLVSPFNQDFIESIVSPQWRMGYIRIKDATHLLPWEYPEDVVRSIREMKDIVDNSTDGWVKKCLTQACIIYQ